MTKPAPPSAAPAQKHRADGPPVSSGGESPRLPGAAGPSAVILRAVAALVLRRGLDGRTFPEAVESTAEAFGREAPQAVREAAAVVRFRMPGATAAEVARHLEAEAGMVEAGEGYGG